MRRERHFARFRKPMPGPTIAAALITCWNASVLEAHIVSWAIQLATLRIQVWFRLKAPTPNCCQRYNSLNLPGSADEAGASGKLRPRQSLGRRERHRGRSLQRNKKGGLLFAATRGLPCLAVSDLSCPNSEDPQP